MVKEINEQEFNKVANEGMVLIDFNATWCGPCQMLKPVLEEVSEEYAGRVSFYGIDTDENQELAVKYGIMSIPALVLLKDGQKVDMSVGFVPKETLEEFINKNL